jgi:hypothetical protein
MGSLQARYSNAPRKRRGEFLVRAVDLPRDARILDLGGATGRHIHDVLPFHSDIAVCDSSERDLKTTRERYSFKIGLLRRVVR